MNKLYFIIPLLLAFSFIFACTESTPTAPYSTGQFINKSTDLNLLNFNAGDYTGKAVVIVGNKFTAVDANDLNVTIFQDIDGGFANSVYLNSQHIDGGHA